eukprot:CAMPEP_0183367052 /NCGR_PEP_ID=MMETSP0164_2-20130417/91100_1 /TAXON_ID=221442 /ORGANISM="Coccolithus pelagicus ssp braarudi, Strain PLY182g" /LENGTH=87 /DNA_ID=CAMNT_0025542929 /DNA_START=88 /DNA_END=351 /DNA_ORIENTATION=-
MSMGAGARQTRSPLSPNVQATLTPQSNTGRPCHIGYPVPVRLNGQQDQEQLAVFSAGSCAQVATPPDSAHAALPSETVYAMEGVAVG